VTVAPVFFQTPSREPADVIGECQRKQSIKFRIKNEICAIAVVVRE